MGGTEKKNVFNCKLQSMQQPLAYCPLHSAAAGYTTAPQAHRHLSISQHAAVGYLTAHPKLTDICPFPITLLLVTSLPIPNSQTSVHFPLRCCWLHHCPSQTHRHLSISHHTAVGYITSPQTRRQMSISHHAAVGYITSPQTRRQMSISHHAAVGYLTAHPKLTDICPFPITLLLVTSLAPQTHRHLSISHHAAVGYITSPPNSQTSVHFPSHCCWLHH